MNRIAELESMLLTEPNDVFLNYALALEHQLKNHYQEALAYYTKTISLDTNYIPAYYQISKIYYQLDFLDIAISFVQKGIHIAELKKDFKSKAELEELLEEFE